jgi:hypothetical protein
LIAPAEDAFFRFGKVRPRAFCEEESAISAGKILRWLLKLKAISGEADRAGYKGFLLNCWLFSLNTGANFFTTAFTPKS